jgi:dolichol-phosphate mannosyltransferase
MLLTIVVPAYNEERNIRANLKVILDAAASPGWDLELIAVDDGSKDGTASQLKAAAEQDSRVRPVFFTRNFGKEAAILAGLSKSNGDAAVVIDSDLQHPPTLIPKMVALWEQGFPVVEAVKSHRGAEAAMDGLSARLFYWLFKNFAGLDLVGQSDFKLLDRAVVKTYIHLQEKHRFFRGLVNWAGYPSARIPFEVAEREGEASRWSKIKLIKYAVNNLTSFSSLPLKVIGWLGGLTLLIGLVISFISLFQKLRGEALDGFTTVILLIVIMGGALMLSLGIIGHYLAHLFDEIKARPSFVIKNEKDFDK